MGILRLLAGLTAVSAQFICTDTCAFAADGACDDGGFGAEYTLCDRGDDCVDCGSRDLSEGTSTVTQPYVPRSLQSAHVFSTKPELITAVDAWVANEATARAVRSPPPPCRPSTHLVPGYGKEEVDIRKRLEEGKGAVSGPGELLRA